MNSQLKTLPSVFAIITLLFSASPLYGQWTQSSTGLNGCPVHAIFADDTQLFVGTASGAYHSMNNGSSWSPVNTGFVSLQINNLVGTASELFAATANGFYSSTNAGAQWTKSASISGGLRLLWMDGDRIFAAPNGGGLFVTTDKGGSWVRLTTGLPENPSVYAIARNSTEIFIGTYTGIYRSSDEGFSWEEFNPDSYVKPVYSLLLKDNALFAGTTIHGNVYKTVYNGSSWSPWSEGIGLANYSDINTLSLIDNKIIAGSTKGLYHSTDNGTSWTALTNGLPEELLVKTLVSNGSSIYAGTERGLYYSSDYGSTWIDLNTQLTCAQAYVFFRHTTKLYAGTNNGLFESSDNGSSWTAVKSLSANSIRCLTSKVGVLFAGTDKGVFASENNAASWTAINSGLQPGLISALAAHNNTLFAGIYPLHFGEYSVYTSDDNGVSWNLSSEGLPASTPAKAFVFMNETVFTALGENVYRSVDNGNSWTIASNELPPVTGNTTINSFINRESTLYLSYAPGGVFKSKDNGISWEMINTGLRFETAGSLASSQSNLFVGGTLLTSTEYGVYTSSNDGVTWVAIESGLPAGARNRVLYVDDNNLYGSFLGDKSVWKVLLEDLVTGTGGRQHTTQHSFCPEMNTFSFPNPTTDHIVITLKNGVQENETITIYDLAGRPVSVMGKTNKAEFILDTSQYRAGTYIIKTTSGNKVCYGKFIKH
jgi:photosystem II stability/assembly factor-like uncharacterized protein